KQDAMRIFRKAEVVDTRGAIGFFKENFEFERAPRAKDLRPGKLHHEGDVRVAVVAAAELRVVKRGAHADKIAGEVLIAKVELNLLVGSFDDKRGDGVDDRSEAAFGNSCCHIDNCRLANYDVEI